MLIFLRHNLAFLATPKTGTTAVEMALRSQAEIAFSRDRKHITAARYANKVAPFLEDTFGIRPPSLAVMREPVDQLRSWYRYRLQDRLAGSPASTRGIDFDGFVREVLMEDPPERARVGRQFSFLTDGADQVMADHLIAYETPQVLLDFLGARLGQPVTLEERNVSPTAEAPISEETLALLRRSRAEDFALHDRLLAEGGHLRFGAD